MFMVSRLRNFILSLALALSVVCVPASADSPCQSPTVKSVPVNITTLTTTQVIAGNATQAILVCSFYGTWSEATSGTAQLITGGGATCGTTTVNQTAAMVMPAATALFDFENGASSLFQAPLNAATPNGVCIITAGTTVSITGAISFVQQ